MSGQLLLVDDEPGIREAVQAYLEDSNFTVDVAANANEGWQKLQQYLPDLVITDVMMPKWMAISSSSKCGKTPASRRCQ